MQSCSRPRTSCFPLVRARIVGGTVLEERGCASRVGCDALAVGDSLSLVKIQAVFFAPRKEKFAKLGTPYSNLEYSFACTVEVLCPPPNPAP